MMPWTKITCFRYLLLAWRNHPKGWNIGVSGGAGTSAIYLEMDMGYWSFDITWLWERWGS